MCSEVAHRHWGPLKQKISEIPSLGLMWLGSEAKQRLTTREFEALIVCCLIKHRDECTFTLPFGLHRGFEARDKLPTRSLSEEILRHSPALREEHNLREEQAERRPDMVITLVTGIWVEQSGFRIPVRAKNVSLLQNVQTVHDSASHTVSFYRVWG